MAAAAPDNPPNLGDGAAAARPPPAPAPPSSSSTPTLLTRFRSVLMTLGSLSLTVLVVMNAWYQRQQFYPSVVYITKSNPR